MSKVGGLGVHEVGGYYIHSEYIRHSLLVFHMFFMTTSNFGGGPLSKSGGLKPPCPPRFSASVYGSHSITKEVAFDVCGSYENSSLLVHVASQ